MNALNNEFIISFGEPSFKGPSRGRHRILWLLANRHQILYVLPQYYLRTGFTPFKTKLQESGLHSIREDLYEFQPPWFLPRNHRYLWLNQLTESAKVSIIKRIISKLGCNKRPILYIWHPKHARMVGQFNEKLVCYHIYDDYFGYEGGQTEEIHYLHNQLLQKADLVFTVSQAIQRSVENSCNRAYLIPNGVDYELFEQASLKKRASLTDINQIPKPRIGYVGNVNCKVDFELLAYLASKRPNWSFVLIGPINAEKDQIGKCIDKRNIYFLGEKEYSQIPDYVAALDACLMPYIPKGWVLSGYPLKMHEYLAAGKPVISADIESVHEFKEIVKIASCPDEWLNMIDLSLKDTNPNNEILRRRIASKNTWDERVSVIENLIFTTLASREQSSKHIESSTTSI